MLGLLLLSFPLIGRNVILEFKGAYFLPTNHAFKKIYHKGGALYGPEVTVQWCDDTNWYVFASLDYFQKKGHSVGLDDVTRVRLIPLAIGLKYFVPIDCLDFYAGLGFQPVNVRTHNCSPFVIAKQSKWGFGGIVKGGTYIHLPGDFLIDIFIDYSFVRVGNKNRCQNQAGVQSIKANVSGAIFGVGIGYNF